MTKDSTIIRLTKIKQWYIPADTETYLVLRKLGLPLTKIHADMLPTIQLVTQKRKVRGVEVNFASEIMNPFLDKIGAGWNKGQYRQCTLGSKELRFETTKKSSLDKAKALIPKLEQCLRRFFARWGYAAQFMYDESRGKLRFTVQYSFDSHRQPIIPLETPAAEIPEFKIAFGATRLVLKLGAPNAATVTYATKHGREIVIDPAAEREARLAAEKALAEAEAAAAMASTPDEAAQILKDARRHDKMTRTEADQSDRYSTNRGQEVEVRLEVKQGNQWALAHLSHCLYSEISSVIPMMKALAKIVNIEPHNMES